MIINQPLLKRAILFIAGKIIVAQLDGNGRKPVRVEIWPGSARPAYTSSFKLPLRWLLSFTPVT